MPIDVGRSRHGELGRPTWFVEPSTVVEVGKVGRTIEADSVIGRRSIQPPIRGIKARTGWRCWVAVARRTTQRRQGLASLDTATEARQTLILVPKRRKERVTLIDLSGRESLQRR